MKKILTMTGILILLLVWMGPLPRMAHSAFYAHMTMHMLVVALASPLIGIGLYNELSRFIDKYPVFFSPIPISVGELLIVWGWHAPLLHQFARHNPWGLFLEQGSFFLIGSWLWISAVARKEAGVLAMLLTSMHMTLLGALLGLSNRQLYPNHQGVGELSALADQQLGGAIMIVMGGVSYICGGLWLTYKVLRNRSHEKLV